MTSSSPVPFSQRFGIDNGKPVEGYIPETFISAIAFLLHSFNKRGALAGREEIWIELLRSARFQYDPVVDYETEFSSNCLRILKEMDWWRVYTFLERVYRIGLTSEGFFDDGENWIETKSVEEVQKFFSSELNEILEEENIVYRFVDGHFQKRGRAQTQKAFQKVGLVLCDPKLDRVRIHFLKARKFFDERPIPDTENCIKDALCAVEACIEILTERPASNDFTKTLAQLQGNGDREIPSPIAESLKKLHSYRGSGQGVGHASTKGSRVSVTEAELVLSLVASYISYFVDLWPYEEDEIPF